MCKKSFRVEKGKLIGCIFFVILAVVALTVTLCHRTKKPGIEKLDVVTPEGMFITYLDDISSINDGTLPVDPKADTLPVYRLKDYTESEDGKFPFINSLTNERIEKIAKKIGKALNVSVTDIKITLYKDKYQYNSVREDALTELMQYIESAYVTYEDHITAKIKSNGIIEIRIDDRKEFADALYDKLNAYKDIYGSPVFYYQEDTFLESFGEYPIITVDDAKALLLSGEYIKIDATTVNPTESVKAWLHTREINEENIAKICIEYINPRRRDAEYCIPFYKFYVAIPTIESDTDSRKAYAIYYIPAIKDEYLSKPKLSEMANR
ncbi:MAG: hypothetical protein IJT81_04295 [Lachnospiraceae bacterium]|nr:hypothetical protein [Lachnospiraceae bacterium]